MSSPKKEDDFKAGHPAAVKAGGMRITQHKTPRTDEKSLLEDNDINNAGLKVASSVPKNITIAGVQPRGNADFPADALQYHEKPLPALDQRTSHNTRPNVIHQPRKQ